ncbi:MAG TPA: DUF3108 domain-containing protein [Alphaproteobacteria bacterium]|nr:DUF3108 domain-containing protein [Alphaproteobacteria bacterium]
MVARVSIPAAALLLAALMLIPISPCADAVAAEARLRFSLTYEMFWHGLPVFSMATSGTLDDKHYTVASTDRTLGLFGLIVDYNGHAETDGAILGGISWPSVRPKSYRQYAHWRGDDRHVTLEYGESGLRNADVDPPPERDDRDPVPASLQYGTIDPLSASILLGAYARPQEPCDARVPIFDGRQRYDLRLDYIGMETIPKNVDAAFGGETIKCRITIERIAGFIKKYASAPPRRPSVVWLARFADGRFLVPVQIEIDTSWGDVIGHLTAITIRRDPSDAN